MSASDCPGQDRGRVFVMFVHTTFIQCLPAACPFVRLEPDDEGRRR
jgi:hypothetical protein